MKKIILIFLMFPCWAMAAEKCTTLAPSGGESCWSRTAEVDYTTADWNTICPRDFGIRVRGISTCAKTPGTWSESEVTARDNLEFSVDASENTYCWCKMVSPAVSRWVYVGKMSVGYCPVNCTMSCIEEMGAYPSFRRAIFSNLKD